MKYTEDAWQSTHYREDYVKSINSFLKNLQDESFNVRQDYVTDIFQKPEEYRQKFKNMLGYPLTEAFDEKSVPNVKKTFVVKEGELNVYRMQIEVLPDFWFYGILFIKDEEKKRPFIIAQHGGGGTPEVASSIHNSSNYNDMIQRALKYDVTIFAPQLLLWYPVNLGVNFDRKALDNSLKQVGSSITAVEVYSIMRTISYFDAQDYVDSERIGMIGLSYGGFYTLFTSACDTRIKAALSCSFYNDRIEHNWTDWTWFNAANTFLDKEVACLVYPRFISILMGDHDEMFSKEKTEKEFDGLKKLAKDKTEWLSTHIFDGNHEFPKDDKYLDEFMQKLFN